MRIDHVQLAIPKGAEDVCRAFWVDLLGMAECPKPESLQGRGGAWFESGDTEIHLGVEADFKPARKAHPAFQVVDLDMLADQLAAAGHAVLWDEAIAGKRRFFTEDPVGNRLEFLGGA